MTSASYHRLGFFTAISGLMFEPAATTARLMSDNAPPFGLRIFLLFLASVFVPLFIQAVIYGHPIYSLPIMLGIVVVVTMTTLLFMLIEGLLLMLLGVDYSLEGLFSCVAYSLTPALLALWIMYIFNYFSSGNLTLLTALRSGNPNPNDPFLVVLPWALVIVQCMGLVVFYYALRCATGLGAVTAFLTTICSLLPLYAALIISLRLADIAHPGTGDSFFRIIGL